VKSSRFTISGISTYFGKKRESESVGRKMGFQLILVKNGNPNRLEEKWDFNSFFQIVQARIAPSARLTILGISTFFEPVSASESAERNPH
jgi:hypothetical protein